MSLSKSAAGQALGGKQLHEIQPVIEYFRRYPEVQYVLWFARRRNKKGALIPSGLPSPNTSYACCWDFHLFLLSRSDARIAPFLSVPESRFVRDPTRLIRTFDNNSFCLHYVYCKFIRPTTSADLESTELPVSFGLCDSTDRHLMLGNFLIRPIAHNSTSNANVVEVDHFLSSPATVLIAIPQSPMGYNQSM
jgi:hypothetical protein